MGRQTRRYNLIIVILVVVGICSSLVGCTNFKEANDLAGEAMRTEFPTLADEMYIPEENKLVTLPDEDKPAPLETETVNNEYSHTHHYISKVIAPSCTAGGYTSFICDCGDCYTRDHTAASEHNFDSWSVARSTVEGVEQRTCTTCGKIEYRSIEELAYERFNGTIGVYNAHNLAYIDWKGDTEQAAFIEVYTVEKSDKALSELAAKFEKAYGFAPSLGDQYRCTTSCNELGTYVVEGYSQPQTVYHYTITDKTYIYITNDMYTVYTQRCADGSVWVGYCIYATMDTVDAERSKPEVQALDREMYAAFEKLIGLTQSEMCVYREELELKLGYISNGGTVRSVHADTPVQVVYIYCRGFAYGENNS